MQHNVNRNLQSRFITFEGIEGAGKSSLIQAIQKEFIQKGMDCIATREPGGTSVAEKIRDILLQEDIHDHTEILLFTAARIEHIEKVIKPALAEQKIVLCDRFLDSTFAYQGVARNLNPTLLETLEIITLESLKPYSIKQTVYLKISPKKGLERAKNPNRFEALGEPFFEKVLLGFEKAAKRIPERLWISLDAEQLSLPEITEQVLKILL